MFQNHSKEVVTHVVIGLIFMVIYFVVFYFAIKKFDIKTPGREVVTEGMDDGDTSVGKGAEKFKNMAEGILKALGGKENIVDVANCMTRLRLTVKDEKILASDEEFKKYDAKGVVRKGKAIQVIIGFDVENVRGEFERLL